MNTVIAELKVGAWYAVCIADLDDAINPNTAPLYRYDGGGEWSDENDEPIESIWDAAIQMWVSVNEADEYIKQA